MESKELVNRENAPDEAQNVQAPAQPPWETSRDSENNQIAEAPETGKEAAVASSALFGLGNNYPKHNSPEEAEWTRRQVKEWKERVASKLPYPCYPA